MRGCELDMAKSTSDNIRIRASVAASRANNEAGTIQDDSPELTGKASASMQVFNLAAYLASEIQYISERSYNWNNMLYKVPDETLANVTVTMPDVDPVTSARLPARNI